MSHYRKLEQKETKEKSKLCQACHQVPTVPKYILVYIYCFYPDPVFCICLLWLFYNICWCVYFKKKKKVFITLQHFWCFVFSLSVHCIQRCEPPGTYSLLSDTTQTNTWYQWCTARRQKCRYSLITAWQINTMNTCAVLCGLCLELRCFGLLYSVDFSGDHMNHYIYIQSFSVFCTL